MELTRVVTLRKKGQLTVPDDVRAALGLEEGQPLWLIQRFDGILLTPHDPRYAGRIAETPVVYTPDVAGVGFAASAAEGVRSAPTLRNLAVVLETGPHLTVDEADAFARDLSDVAAEANRDGVEDPLGS